MIDLSTKVTVDVPAVLVLHPDYGPDRPATIEDLRAMGFRHHNNMYQRFRDLCAAMGIHEPGDDPRWSLLRYFVEYVTTYDHDMDPGDFERFRAMIDSAAIV